jgi:ribonuclease H / adenosylcobalamin/alpha-ribazole phosphatase
MYKLYFDGASRGNPGLASYGGVIVSNYGDNAEMATYAKVLPKGTSNNVSEYTGLLEGLKKAQELCIDELEVYGDSKLVINQMNGIWSVKHPNMKVLYEECKKVEKFFVNITYCHVERKFNKRADALANSALDACL